MWGRRLGAACVGCAPKQRVGEACGEGARAAHGAGRRVVAVLGIRFDDLLVASVIFEFWPGARIIDMMVMLGLVFIIFAYVYTDACYYMYVSYGHIAEYHACVGLCLSRGTRVTVHWAFSAEGCLAFVRPELIMLCVSSLMPMAVPNALVSARQILHFICQRVLYAFGQHAIRSKHFTP